MLTTLRLSDSTRRVQKIKVRSRKYNEIALRSTNQETTTTCSPNSPKRIRIILPTGIKRDPNSSNSRDLNSSSRTDLSPSTSCSSTNVSGEVKHGTSVNSIPDEQLIRLVNDVVKELWRRDYYTNPLRPSIPPRVDLHDKDLIIVRSSAIWYVDLYKSHYVSSDATVALAGVFLAFKAADYIPGTGRIKMQELLDAYSRILVSTAKRPLSGIGDCIVESICNIEIEMMCLSGFNFEPIIVH